MKKVHLIFRAVGLLLGLAFGRLLPPAQPPNWSQIENEMPFEHVYRAVPELGNSMKTLKGFDTCSAKNGNRYWQILVHYDQEDRVSKVEKRFHWL